MIKKHIVILLFFLCAIAASCTQQRAPCAEPILVSLRFTTASTHVIDTALALDSAVAADRVSFDTLLPNAILGSLDAVNNQVYYFGTTAQFTLFLNPNADSCRWYLSQDSGRTPIDTITFYYQRSLQFLSNACGYTYYYTLTKPPTTPNLRNNLIVNSFDTVHKIDSIIIENASVTNNVNLEHLQIYIHNPH